MLRNITGLLLSLSIVSLTTAPAMAGVDQGTPIKPLETNVSTDPSKNIKTVDYTVNNCGLDVFTMQNTIVNIQSDGSSAVNADSALQSMTKTIRAELAYGVMVASLDFDIDDENRIFLATTLVNLYTDMNDQYDILFSEKIISKLKATKFYKQQTCANPDQSMKYINDAFENGRIYTQWRQNLKMQKLQFNTIPE